MYRFRGFLGIAIVAVVALLLAACSTGETSNSGSSGNASVSEAVKANVEKYKGLPAFTPPGPAIDVSKLRARACS